MLNGFVFARTLFGQTLNLKANICQNSYLKFLQGSVATLFRQSLKILLYFVANLSRTPHINFYQNWSIIADVIGVFLCLTV